MTHPPRPPRPPGHWLLGNLPEFRRDMLGFFTRCNRQYGDLVALRFGHRLVHLATHPDFVEQILVTENRKFGKSCCAPCSATACSIAKGNSGSASAA
jgi:hypothetical protein